VIGALTGLIVIIAGGSHAYLGEANWGVGATISGIAIVVLLFEERRRAQDRCQAVQEEISDTYSQIDALLSIRSDLGVTEEFPPTRGWAASPDFLRELIRIIRRRSPMQIVEAGSGVSTLVSALALNKYGEGEVVALENGEEFADTTREYLRLHGVEDNANVIHAPLTEHTVDGNMVTWYDSESMGDMLSIDLLIVDGPPAHRNEETRWPALPLLENRLETDAQILLDDGDRPGEQQIVKDWCQRFEFESTYLPLEEGAYCLQRCK